MTGTLAVAGEPAASPNATTQQFTPHMGMEIYRQPSRACQTMRGPEP